MKDIVGQSKLLNHINNLSLDTFPRSILLTGKRGSGKHLICEYISNILSISIVDISQNINLETIEQINSEVEPHLYIIDGKYLTIKNESVLLKFLEEPLKNAYIIILCENKQSIIPTVLNRCQVWSMDVYTKEQLNQFVEDEPDKEFMFEICETPGQIEIFKNQKISEMMNLADKMFDKIGYSNFSNMLTISNKINFKENNDKFDFYCFIDILCYVIKTKIFKNSNKFAFDMFGLTNDFKNSLSINNIDNKYLFEHYLIELRLLVRGENI